jgi:hypothetical protein
MLRHDYKHNDRTLGIFVNIRKNDAKIKTARKTMNVPVCARTARAWWRWSHPRLAWGRGGGRCSSAFGCPSAPWGDPKFALYIEQGKGLSFAWLIVCSFSHLFFEACATYLKHELNNTPIIFSVVNGLVNLACWVLIGTDHMLTYQAELRFLWDPGIQDARKNEEKVGSSG